MHLLHMLIEFAVGVVVEVVGLEHQDQFIAQVGQKQNTAQDRDFRRYITGRLAIENGL